MLSPDLKQKAPLLVLLLCTLVAAGFTWLLIDRLVFSGFNLGLQVATIEPLRDTSRLSWFRTDNATATAPPQPPAEQDNEYQDAAANAKLTGVLIGADGRAFAAVQTPQRADGLYSAGDEIMPNLVLLRVEPGRIVVQERGLERQIRLQPLVAATAGQQGGLIESLPDRESSGFSLSGVLGATPVPVAGEGLGLRLDALDSEVAAMTGLQRGDIVLALDGQPVAQLIANEAAFQRLSEETALQVRVRRGEQDLELTVNARSMRERILPELGQGMVQ